MLFKKTDSSFVKSKYCTQSATKAFEELIKNINAKYIVVSYNNMANRSNACFSDPELIQTLENKGSVKIFPSKITAFTTGKSNIEDNEESFFLQMLLKSYLQNIYLHTV